MSHKVDCAEIAQKLHLDIGTVSSSNAIQNTFMQIKNDTTISESEREEMYNEMASIFKSMAGKK